MPTIVDHIVSRLPAEAKNRFRRSPKENNEQRKDRRGESVPTIKLTDPNNPGIDVGPGDYLYDEFVPTPAQSITIQDTTRLVQGDLNYRRVVEPRVFENLAMFSGMQLLKYNYTLRALSFGGGEGSKWKVRTTRPVIRPKIKRMHAKSFSHEPDASIKASNGESELDIGAAEEGRAILADNDHRQQRDRQTKMCGKWALVTGICGLLSAWDPRGWAEVPTYKQVDDNDPNSALEMGEDGEPIITGSKMEPKGCLLQRIVPFQDLLLDSQAREYSEMGHIGIRKVRTLADIRAQYPKFGPAVQPNAGTGIGATVESRMASIVNEYVRGAEPGPVKKNCAEVWEIWFPVTDIHPNGYHVVMANNILLAEDAFWPNMDAKKLAAQGIRFPISLMIYEEQMGSLYPLDAVHDMVPSQRSINNTVSRLEEHRNTSWGKWFFESMSIPVDAFDDAMPNEKIPVKQGSTYPQNAPPPAAPEWMFDLIKLDESFIDDISGLHETSEGSVPTGVTAAQAIMSLAALDELMGVEFASNIEAFHHHRATLELHICGQNYSEPRLMYVSQGYFGDPAKKINKAPVQQVATNGQPGQQPGSMPSTTPQQPQIPNAPPSALKQVKSFKALANGGSCHLVITPGSALAKDPVAMRAEVFDYYKAGLFGPVGLPTTAQIVLNALNYAGGDEIVQMMEDTAYKNLLLQLATAANPAAQQQSDQAHQQEMEQLKSAMEDHKTQTKLAADSQLAQLKGQIEQDKINSQLAANEQIATMQRELASAQAMLEHLNNRITASVTLSPQAQAAYEQETFGVSPSTAAADMQHQAQILATAAPAQANAIKQKQVENQAQQAQQSTQMQQQQIEQEQQQAQPATTDDSSETETER